MTLSAAETVCKRSIKDRTELERQIAEYQAKGGEIKQVEPQPVRSIPHRFVIKPERVR